MLGHAFQRFPCQVQPVEIGVALFKAGNQPQRMGVMVEAAERFHRLR